MIVLKLIEQYKQFENLTIFLKYVQHSKVIQCPVINLRCYGNSFGRKLHLTYIPNPTRIPTILKVLNSTSLMPIVARAQFFAYFAFFWVKFWVNDLDLSNGGVKVIWKLHSPIAKMYLLSIFSSLQQIHMEDRP